MHRRHFLRKSIITVLGSNLAFSGLPPGGTDRRLQQNISIIDTHVHLWDLEKLQYPWLENRKSPLSRNFLTPDYRKATEGCPIEKMVFVECGRSADQYLEEVDWVVAQSRLEPRIQGMVAYLPIEKGNKVIPEIEQLTARKIVRGIRHGVNKELMANREFIQGLQLLPHHNLSFDLNISSSLMPEAISMIRQCPDTSFILDHLGNPNIKEKEINPWKKYLSQLAGIENVYVKLSGIITKADPKNWKPDDLRPYVDHALEAFGTNRIMYGGDWPVVLLAGSYKDWLSALRQIINELSEDEKKRLFYGNAEKIYRL